MRGVLELSGRTPGVIGQTIIINTLNGKWNITLLKELLPTDALSPITNTLILTSIFGIGLEDTLNGRYRLRPPGRGIGQEGDNQFRELGSTYSIGNLTTNQNGNTVTLGISKGMAGHMV